MLVLLPTAPCLSPCTELLKTVPNALHRLPLGWLSFPCLHWVSPPTPPGFSSLNLPHCHLVSLACEDRLPEFTGCPTPPRSPGSPFWALGKNSGLPARPLRVRQARPAPQASPPRRGAERSEDHSLPETHCLEKLPGSFPPRRKTGFSQNVFTATHFFFFKVIYLGGSMRTIYIFIVWRRNLNVMVNLRCKAILYQMEPMGERHDLSSLWKQEEELSSNSVEWTAFSTARALSLVGTKGDSHTQRCYEKDHCIGWEMQPNDLLSSSQI